MQQDCARALSNLTASEAHRGPVAAAGGTDALVTAMRSHGGDVLVRKTVLVLANLTTSEAYEGPWLLPEASMRW